MEEGPKRRENRKTHHIISVSRPICQHIHPSLSAKDISCALCPPKLEFLVFWARRGWLSGPLLDPYLCSNIQHSAVSRLFGVPKSGTRQQQLEFRLHWLIGTPLSLSGSIPTENGPRDARLPCSFLVTTSDGTQNPSTNVSGSRFGACRDPDSFG